MKNISTKTELQEAIRLLEIEQAEQAVLLKETFYHVYENLNPITLVKNLLADVTSPHHFLTDILNNAIALATGYISKKLVVNRSASGFQKLWGSVFQFSITTLVLKYKEQIRSITNSIIQSIFSLQSMFSKKENEVT